MRWFYDLPITWKLLISFALVLVLTSTLGVFSLTQLVRVNQSSVDISTNSLPSVSTTLQLKVTLSRIRAIQLQHILSANENDFLYNEKMLNEQNDALKQLFIDFGPLAIEEMEKQALATLIQKFNLIQAAQKKITALSRAGKQTEARDVQLNEFNPLYFQSLAEADRLVSSNILDSVRAGKKAQTIFESSRIMVISMLTTCIVLGIMMALWVSRMVVRPLQQAVNFARAVAGGDLTTKIHSGSKDETGQLMIALQSMADGLIDIVSRVHKGTGTIANASSEIASGNLDLSTRTEQQASSLQHTASSMSELTATVKQNADNAHQANQLAMSASDIAVRGGSVVAQVIETMESIDTSSRKIVDIISVIDGIAFQTNILALNAAVEAARAGEQGRGFAVVASEVRSLAQRSANAAKEIKALIDDSVNKVGVGSELVSQAGTTMSEVVGSVKRVTDIVGEITLASRSQSSRIEQVNQSIAQMDEVTQQNAALVEEAAAAARSLQDQASTLAKVVDVFKLDQIQTASASSPARLPPRPAMQKKTPTKISTTHTKLSATTSPQNDNDGNSWEQF